MTRKNLVWFKRDLRVIDHEPLLVASQTGDTVGVFIVEDQWIASDEFSPRHWQFAKQCLVELENALQRLNIPLLIMQGDCVECFTNIRRRFPFGYLYSHMETGVDWSFQRDLKVKEWCKQSSIVWRESKQFAVIRKLKSRDTWNAARKKIIQRPLHLSPSSQSQSPAVHEINSKPLEHFDDLLKPNTLQSIQTGGRQQAKQLLDSFLQERGMHYSKHMSSPNTAFEQCSRLSPHIAWGTLSIAEIQKDVRQAYEQHQQQPEQRTWYRSLKAFESRLWWHCHFIQKLESEPSMQFRNVNAGFDGMRENDFDTNRFHAWAAGETGFPIIDACMRALHQHGWINFRMRAMLISFASYQLWLHWIKPAHHLARLFTDFEPGIHYSQIQMQSGVTGINAIRIYSPIKQAKDQDPEGTFIRKYCPELSALSNENIHEPHLTPPLEQIACGVEIGRDYPHPIVDHAQAYQQAKQQIFSWRSKPKTKALAQTVLSKHGSRKNSYFPTQKRAL